MVQSEKSGIMFTVDPMSQDKDRIVIEGGWGLGEAIVLGAVTPDHYVVSKSQMKIIEKKINQQTWKITKVGKENKHVTVPKQEQGVQKISDEEILELAKYGKEIEKHYQFPQDNEWAIEPASPAGGDGRIYFVQSRPITTLNSHPERSEGSPANAGSDPKVGDSSQAQNDKLEILLKGAAASLGIASGPVKILHKIDQMDKIQKGDILVTEMTTPDYVPAMKRAVGIVTDTGGQTSHAAIVSRELGIPCVVGTGTATHTLKDGQVVSVDGAKGVVYKGKIARAEAPVTAGAGAATPSGSMNVNAAQAEIPVTATKVYVNLGEPEAAERVAQMPCDGVGLLRAEFMIAEIGEHPRALVKAGKANVYVDKLTEGMRTICGAFFPRPVVYRATDFKTNEYKNLKGGKEFEPQENNPMIGYRGASRYIKEPDLFNLELEAIKKVRNKFDMKNLWLMIPFVRTIEEMEKVMKLVRDAGLEQTNDFKLWMMVEVPSNVILMDRFCRLGIDGVSIGSNDLTQLTLGIDRDNEHMKDEFDERDDAVRLSIAHVIKTCRAHHITCSICGQAATTYPEIAELMVREGATSVSVSPDSVLATRRLVASVEKKILLSQAIDER
jgi:pyruvate,water dikinase